MSKKVSVCSLFGHVFLISLVFPWFGGGTPASQ